MRSVIDSFIIAVSMYSSIPVRSKNWNEKNLRYALAFFPFIGVVCGAVLFLVWSMADILGLSSFLTSVLFVLSVAVVTGGIHTDGFCDTADALFSRRSREEKLRILKDPNCGPFSVLSVIMIFLVTLSSFYEIKTNFSRDIVFLVMCGFVNSRCMSGFSITTIKSTPTSSLAKLFGENAGRSVSGILAAEYVISSVVMFCLYGKIAFVLLLNSLIVFWLFYNMQKKQFGGITGDLAGFLLVIEETVFLLTIAMFGGVLM